MLALQETCQVKLTDTVRASTAAVSNKDTAERAGDELPAFVPFPSMDEISQSQGKSVALPLAKPHLCSVRWQALGSGPGHMMTRSAPGGFGRAAQDSECSARMLCRRALPFRVAHRMVSSMSPRALTTPSASTAWSRRDWSKAVCLLRREESSVKHAVTPDGAVCLLGDAGVYHAEL